MGMDHLRHALNCGGLLSFYGVALAIVSPAASEECVELAQREGVPTVIENKFQAAKATL